MRIAVLILFCLLTVASPGLVMVQPAAATTGAPPITDPEDGDQSGMTCCHAG